MIDFNSLSNFLVRIPSINSPIATGSDEEGYWWVKFRIDIDNIFAWQAVQQIGYVANYLSIEEKLPTLFFPVSPPPYLNGGPDEFLSWVIECNDPNFKPHELYKWLENRLPNPIDDLDAWKIEDEDENNE
jgi:hypothetical protein